MQDLLEKVISNPWLLAIGVILVIVLLYAIFKRIVKLLLFLALAIILFLVYVHYTGNSVKEKIERRLK